jgi:hypothetical protein
MALSREQSAFASVSAQPAQASINAANPMHTNLFMKISFRRAQGVSAPHVAGVLLQAGLMF